MALNSKSIRNLIFDLDDTLFDTHGQLVKPASIESCRAMIETGLKANLEECLLKREEFQKKYPRKDIYELLAKHFGVDGQLDDVVRAGTEAFLDRTIKEVIMLFPDTAKTLENLKTQYKLFLVTMGTPRTQKKKIEMLKLSDFFEKIFIVDVSKNKSKKSAFQEILDLTKEAPANHVSIGNRLDMEIRNGKELGMQTILFEHGEYLHLKPEHAHEEPDAVIQTLSQLAEKLTREHT